MKKILSVSLFLLICLFPQGVFAADLVTYPENEGVMVMEITSGDVLLDQNEDQTYYPASTTKLMTALVAMDYVNDQLDQTITVGHEIDEIGFESSTASLEVGENYTWEEIFYAMLLPSGNDAADVIAVNIGRIAENDPTLTEEVAKAKFITLMNEKAETLALTHTHFVNPHGLHDDDHYTTPEDLASIAKAVLENDFLKTVVQTPVYEMTIANTGEQQKWENTNLLFYSDVEAYTYDTTLENNAAGQSPYYNAYVNGVKTGYTEEAGHCLVFSAQKDDMILLGVIMKADTTADMYTQANNTINQIFENYSLKQITDENNELDTETLFRVHRGENNLIKPYTKESLAVMQENSDTATITTTIHWNEDYIDFDEGKATVIQSIPKDAQIGTVVVSSDDQTLKEVAIYVDQVVDPWQWDDYLLIYWYVWAIVLGIVLLAVFVPIYRRKNRIGVR